MNPSPNEPLPRLDRRLAIKWMLAAAGSAWLYRPGVLDAQTSAPGRYEDTLDAGGYGMDPNLQKDYPAGELWPLTLTESERRTARALADLIIPADEHSPSATAVGVVDFIDEWISAPYRPQGRDQPVIVEGLAWLEQTAASRFSLGFTQLSPGQQTAICDEICCVARAGHANLAAARFFALFRDLTAGGFYTTREGWADVKYVGNIPLASFAGPPESVRTKLGLD